ncbi:hypothetical protein [Reyranella sp.]|jgi:hypothetical protein|uniref:hypothetical protein n=1 Tax=Reyranella sp. TaxID=1929291 RepID=UPI002F92CAC2
MNRRLLDALIGGAALVGTGIVIATAAPKGPVFIAGDQPVTEDQIRKKLLSDSYSNVHIVRQGRYFEATGARDGKTDKIRVDSQTGRLAVDDDDDDDDD